MTRKRQRQVFPRDEVAHLWAHRAQDSARDQSGNFYFTGQALYSYGSHFCIAYILGDECGPELAGRVLWNDATYSNTTTTMQTIARQALTRRQRDTIIHWPADIGMGRAVDPQGIERDISARKLPSMTGSILWVIVSAVSELAGKRYGSGPFNACVSRALTAETTARILYERAGRKYPLPLMDSRPVSSDKQQWAAWIKSMSAGKIRDDYAAEVKAAKDYAAQAEQNAAECTEGFPYAMHRPGQQCEARNIVASKYDAAQRATIAIRKAKALYKSLHNKPAPASLRKLSARMAELARVFAARREEVARAESRSRVIYDIREAVRLVHSLRDSIRKGKAGLARRFSDMATLHKRAIACQLPSTLYLGLAARASRIGAAIDARHALNDAGEALRVAQSYMPTWPSDAKRHATDAIRKLQSIARLDIASGLYAHLMPEIERIQSAAVTLANEAHAAIIAKHAGTLRAWLSGKSNVRPHWEAGTYARINGNVIETTMGANVPIAHACRLSRLYAIVVKRGGQEWEDGAGPMVGHYRVNSIGADGSLVIGCHEFDATEAKRLHDLLKDCAECEGV